MHLEPLLQLPLRKCRQGGQSDFPEGDFPRDLAREPGALESLLLPGAGVCTWIAVPGWAIGGTWTGIDGGDMPAVGATKTAVPTSKVGGGAGEETSLESFPRLCA